MPDKSPATLRRLSDSDLNEFIGGWKAGSADYIAGLREQTRRDGRPNYRLSVLALLVAIAALGVSIFK
jgi:hypothetical protein